MCISLFKNEATNPNASHVKHFRKNKAHEQSCTIFPYVRTRLPPILPPILTKCHARHAIRTLSPLHAALPMRFADTPQHDTSQMLRLPRNMKMDTSKVLRLPRKVPHMF